MTRVGIVGDLHGNTRWAIHVLEALADQKIQTVYQVGDFGLLRGEYGKRYLDAVSDACDRLQIRLWIIPGNHEDYSQVHDFETLDGAVPPLQILRWGMGWEIALLPRGYRWEVDGKSFLAFGGAPSIDFQMRRKNIDWWSEEAIRESDLLRLDSTEKTDVMLTHDAPDGGTAAVQRIIDTPWSASGWSREGLTYAGKGREMMNRAVDIVQPRMFFHGHFHVADMRLSEKTDWISLGMNGQVGNAVLLDLESMAVELLVA